MAEEKKKVVLIERDKQVEHINSDIDKMKTQINQMTKAVEMMEQEFVDCVKMAEEKKDISYVIKGNGLKWESDQTKDSITALEKEIEGFQEKKRKEKALKMIDELFTFVFCNLFFLLLRHI